MGEQEATERPPDEGSIEWYQRHGGGFVRHLVQAMQRADGDNLERLRAAFPQVAAALGLRSWYEAPPGFAPRYNATAEATITLPPDKDLGAMVEAIEAETHFDLTDAEIPFQLRRRLALIQGHAERLAVALEQRERVMKGMAGALEEAHSEAVEAEECWRIGCLRDQNHAATRSNRNVAVRVATDTALAQYKEPRRVP